MIKSDLEEILENGNFSMDNIYFDEATGQLMQSVTTELEGEK